MPLPPLQNLLAFVRSVETGRLRAAAQSLHVTESAVSHQIARLEQQLSTKLLDRGRSGMALTVDGQRLFNVLGPALRDIESALAALSHERQARLSITTPQSFAALWLVPRLHLLAAAFPKTEYQLLPSDRVLDLVGDKVDVGIRWGTGPWPGCEAVPFTRERIFPVCAPALVETLRRGGWKRLPATHTLIVNALHRDEWERWCEGAGLPPPPKRQRRIELGTFDLIANAAVSGLGIAMGRSPLTSGLEATGALQRPFPDLEVAAGMYHLVTPVNSAVRGEKGRVIDWLRAEAAKEG